MDPITISALAGAVLVALQPYLPVITNKAAEKVGEELPSAISKLWTELRKRMSAKEASKEAADDLLAHPESEAFQTVFKVQLEKILAADKDFVEELRRLVSEAEAQTGVNYQATVKGSGAIAQGTGARAVGERGILIEGGVKGDFTAGQKGKDEE